MRYVIENKETKSTKIALKKFGTQEIKFASGLEGSFKIVGYRKYTWGDEVDVDFIGRLEARVYREKTKMYDSSIMKNKEAKVSKVKVNRLIRKRIFDEVKSHASYFNIDIKYFSNIKKLNWK
jgi:hypothetical protein